MCLDVVIVTHNAGHFLADAVSSAIAQAGASHVWVVDADSTDDSVDALREQGLGINLLPVPNRGFAAANNRGIESTDSALVLLLNPDAALCPGALDALVATAQAHPRAGIIGPLILNPDGSVQANSFGRFPTFFGAIRLRLWRIVQRLRGNPKLSPNAPVATAPVDWVSGAAMLVRRAAIREVGLMDEGFFLYYEDVEWCHRMRRGGWEVLLEPRAHATHHLGGSMAPGDATALAYRSSFYRYCDLHGLWGLKICARSWLALRRFLGGAP